MDAFILETKVGFNDSFSAYLYAVLLTACLLFMMEAIMLMVRLQRSTRPIQARGT